MLGHPGGDGTKNAWAYTYMYRTIKLLVICYQDGVILGVGGEEKTKAGMRVLGYDAPCANIGFGCTRGSLQGFIKWHFLVHALLCRHSKHTSINTSYITLLLRLSTKNHFAVAMLLEFGLANSRISERSFGEGPVWCTRSQRP